MEPTTNYHQSVLLHECVEQLAIEPDGVYIDATLGGGGHSREILKKLGPNGVLMVFDQDADAKQNLPEDNRVIFIPENFRYAARFHRLHKLPKLNGVLADLGVSSFQFDTAERGFSIRYDAALDMRMDTRASVKASDIVNQYTEANLCKLFEQYGEVTNAKVLAKHIVHARKSGAINTIQEFKQIIANCVYGNPNKYLAQVFQALRIEVNQELEVLKEFLKTITNSMSSGARLCVITFHSLEDRIVKNWMKNESFEEENEWMPRQHTKSFKIVTKKPITPTEQEQKQNNRSRSAKLRVAQKI